jgi:hypothetical protein
LDILLNEGEWKNQTLKELAIISRKESESIVKRFISLNTPIQTMVFTSVYLNNFNSYDITEELKFNSNICDLHFKKEIPWNRYYLERNKQWREMKNKFKVTSISMVKWFDISFRFQ